MLFDTEIISEYNECINAIFYTPYENVMWMRVKMILTKLMQTPDSWYEVNKLLIASGISFLNYIKSVNGLSGCPCECVRFCIKTFEPPSYLDFTTTNTLLFTDFLYGKPCYCGYINCNFKPPQPLASVSVGYPIVNNQFSIVRNTYHKPDNIIGFSVNPDYSIIG